MDTPGIKPNPKLTLSRIAPHWGGPYVWVPDTSKPAAPLVLTKVADLPEDQKADAVALVKRTLR